MLKHLAFYGLLATISLVSCSKSEDISGNTNEEDEAWVLPESGSAYVSNVVSYTPAPGQFMNLTQSNSEAVQSIVGKKGTALSLGAFGGSIILQFDHLIPNKEGNDFIVFSNTINEGSEPGIVQVSVDNKTWYTLKGSAQGDTDFIQNYEVVYTKPDETDGELKDIAWTDNLGNQGVIPRNNFYKENSYWPEEHKNDESIRVTGIRLPNTMVEQDGKIVYPPFDWGYADNYSEEYKDHRGNQFDIDNAIDDNGNSISLDGVEYIRIYTAVLIDGKHLGEASTEVAGAADLSYATKE